MALGDRWRSWWPWRESTSATSDFTEQVTDAVYAAVAGELPDAPARYAGVVQAAAGEFGSALALADLDAAGAVAQALAPTTRAWTAMQLVISGDAVLLPEPGSGGLVFQPAWIVESLGTAKNLRHRIRVEGPDRSRELVVDEQNLIHPIWRPDGPRWYRGIPASRLGAVRAIANWERNTGDEASGPVGYTYSMPHGDMDDEAQDEYLDLIDEQRSMPLTRNRGRVLGLITSYKMPFRRDMDSAAPARADKVVRYGPEYAAPAPLIGDVLTGAAYNALQVPASMMSRTAAGSVTRDARRIWLGSTVTAMMDLIAGEIAAKTGLRCRIRPARQTAAQDVVSRGRAVQSLTGAGMELQEALRIAGLE